MSQDLIKRLEAATEGNRELDGDIMTFLGLVPAGAVRTSDDWFDMFREKRTDPHIPPIAIPSFTSSIDAAVALAELVLPNRWPEFLREADKSLSRKYDWHICLRKPDQLKEYPIQICIAILKAKEAYDTTCNALDKLSLLDRELI